MLRVAFSLASKVRILPLATRIKTFRRVAIATGLIMAVFLWWRFYNRANYNTPGPIRKIPEATDAMLEAAELRARPFIQPARGVVIAGIVPHHLLAAPLVSAFFQGLRQSEQPRTVVIVGPDHERQARAAIVTSKQSWMAPDGRVDVDQRLVRTLTQGGLASIDEALIQREPGVYTPVSFIRRTWPARVVLIALRSDAEAPLLDRLAAALVQSLGPDDMVLASVDFSHYKDLAGAAADDAVSFSVIREGQADAALHIAADSPPAISLLLRFVARRGLQYQELVHSNSAELAGNLTQTSITTYLTSYFFGRHRSD